MKQYVHKMSVGKMRVFWVYSGIINPTIPHTIGNYKEESLGVAPQCWLGVLNPISRGTHEALRIIRGNSLGSKER